MSLPTFSPTAAQLDQTRQAIAAYVDRIRQHPDQRAGAYPYYLLHEPGQPVYGTVMMFHGFSARPHQMWRLADYLFRNGFNVYQSAIAGHVYVNPAQNWPQVDLQPAIAAPLKEKVQQDPVLGTYLKNVMTNPEGFTRPNRLQRMALIARMVAIEPRLLDIVKSLELANDPDFDRYFISSHMNYLTDAEARLAELVALPGPVFTVGLSVGGAVALGLAAAHPERVKQVVAYAPLLRIYGDDRRRYINLAGPLDITESGWDPNLRFPVGCLTAADRFGCSYVMSGASVRSLQDTPVFLTLTENEDAADIETNTTFFDKLGGSRNGNFLHLYPAKDLVPHPMIDPTEVSQGMSNRFWQSLYQETYRFLTTGTVNLTNLSSLEQNSDLPPVPPA
ncbi:MAG: alpha/beta hydrolase-fold protein [Leptolyngbyaceae cyanobacterium bins.349]|nr:alpha/beta hydrolase-fold protein [Leptolyngbyaceae cyanobacterium bins.349]